MLRKFCITLLVMLCMQNFLYAQNFINYTTKDGLPSNLIYRLTQDNQGFIWAITDKGISKFDGYSFKNFTINDGLPTNDIWNIRITPDQKVWFFTKSDALGYIENDKVFSFKTSVGKVILPIRINQSKNSIWINEVFSKHRFIDSVWQESPIEFNKHKAENRDFNISLTINQKLSFIKNDGDTIFSSKGLIRKQAIDYQLNDSLYVVRNDEYYEFINLNSFKSEYAEYKNHSNFEATLDNARIHLVNNHIQITGNDKLVVLDDHLKWQKEYDIPRALKSHFSFKDKDGWIWVATFTNGIYKLPKNYDNINRLFKGKRISVIKHINDIMYVGVLGEGIYKVENNEITLNLPYTDYIYDVLTHNGQIIYSLEFHLGIEENDKISLVEREESFNFGKHFESYKSELFSEGFLNIYSYNDTNKELNAYETGNFSGIFIQNDTLFSTDNKQLVYFENKSNGFKPYKNLKLNGRFTESETFNNNTFIGVEGKGVFKFKDGKIKALVKNDIATISKFFIENETSIWCVSNNHLEYYKANENGEFSKQVFSEVNGLPIDNLRDISSDADNLYLATESGVLIIDKSDVLDVSEFTTYLKSVKLNGNEISKSNIEIPYNKNQNLNIDFSAINYNNALETEFAYKLQPLQKDWVNTTAGEINFGNLSPNEYELKLKVYDNKNESLVSLPIIIKPLWWQNTAFKIAMALLAIVLVYFVSRYFAKKSEAKRNKKIIEQKQLSELQLKALRSQMNPHFVFNSLAAIQSYISQNNFKTSEKYLIKFSNLIRQYFELSTETKITIKDEVELLKNYLDIEKLRFREKLDYTIYNPSALNQFQIPTMLLQPIVENAINHGIFNKKGKGTITITFAVIDASTVSVKIVDDGVGFKRTIKRGKSKLKSSQVLDNRLHYLNNSGNWIITYSEEEAFLDRSDKGNCSKFIIKQDG